MGVECLEDRRLLTVLPAGFTEVLVADELAAPTSMAIAPDGRIFVAEQQGALRVIENGVLLAAPFVTVAVSSLGERGLLGVAVDPEFDVNPYVYVYYTTAGGGIHNRVSRFTASGNTALPASELVLIENGQPAAQNHMGGALRFAADNTLLVAMGDNANPSNAQLFDNLSGKVLRINRDGSIPSDNPFFRTASGVNRAIWALGLRNPFTLAVDPGSDRVMINDVGAAAWEEVNQGIAGANYGWPDTEGPTTNPNYVTPIFAYPHSNAAITGCSVVGGAFYNPLSSQFPAEYQGDYFFGDFCGNWIRRIDDTTLLVEDFATDISAMTVGLALDQQGALYYLSRGTSPSDGTLHRIEFPSGQVRPTIAHQPADRTVADGTEATFSVSASGPGVLTYRWQRNGVEIPTATGASYSIGVASLADDGALFRVVVTNAFGAVTSREALLTVIDNDLPVAEIIVPEHNTRYSAGDTIAFAGSANDAEDGDLPAAAFRWWVDFHHRDHVHPFLAPVGDVTSGSFTIPTTVHGGAEVWFRIHLVVTDSLGGQHSTFADLVPRIVSFAFATDPAGLQLRLDGQPITTPFTMADVVGLAHQVGADAVQSLAGTSWQFVSWSDGGSAAHDVTIPETGGSLTATFQPVAGHGAWLVPLYADVFGRQPAMGDVLYWSGILAGGTTPAQVADAFFDSLEYQAVRIGALYQRWLGRAVESDGLAWWSSIWDSESWEGVQEGIIGSAESLSLAGSHDAWIASLYQELLSRGAVEEEVEFWRGGLLSSAEAGAVVRGFLTSDEYRVSAIAGWYAAYLDRAISEADEQYWLSQCQLGAVPPAIQVAILSSHEYLAAAGAI